MEKTAGSGEFKGMNIIIQNTGTSSADVKGIQIALDVSGVSTTASRGIEILEQGSAGTLQDGISIASNNSGSDGITDAIDVSDPEITNAINLGDNTILGNGSFSIDLLNASADTLTITNSNSGGSALASVAVEGGLTIGNNGANPGTAITKHLSATASIDVGQPIGGGCETFTVTLNGAASGDTVVATPANDSGGTAFSGVDAIWSAWANTNQVRLRICAPGNSWPYNPDAVTWRFDVWQH